jgi:hypothetical protein
MENLYLIKCNEFFKIGIANDLQSRLASLQTGNPYPLVVEACFEFPNAGVIEKALHQVFSGVRTLGEWFSLGNDDVIKFSALCRMLGGVEVAVRSELVDEEEIEEAEEVQEFLLDDPELRIEKRYGESGGIVGFALRERNKDRKVVRYIGKRSNRDEFDAMLAKLGKE